MFSSHLPPMNIVPRVNIFAGAGLLLVVSMLAGIAMVASGQVRKAELRELQLVSQRSAVGACRETLGGLALKKCILQTKASPDPAGSTAVSAGSSQGLIPLALSTHR